MSESNIWNKSVSVMCDNVNALMRYETSTTYQTPIWVVPKLEQLNNNVDDFNFEMSYIKSLGSENAYSKWQGKFIPKETVRCCYVDYLAHVKIGSTNTDTIIHNVILVGNNMGTDAYTDAMFDVKDVGCVTAYSQGAVRHDNSGRNIYPAYYGTWQYTSFESFGLNFLRTSSLNDSNLTSAVNNMMCEDNTEMFNFLRAVSSDVPNSFFGGNTRSQYTGSNFFNGLWFYPLGAHAYDYTISKLPFPVFKIEDTSNIIDYLLTGDPEGSYDPFDPTSKSKTITDYGTNFRVFITPETVTQIDVRSKHKSIAYNTEYIAGGELMTANYGLQMFERYFTSSGDPKEWQKVDTRSQPSYPNITVLHTMNSTSSAVWEVCYIFRNLYDNQCFGFSIRYRYKSVSEVGLSIDDVRCYTDFINRPDYFSMATRSNITDGYRFTANNGHYIEILFRESNSSDLKEDYSVEPDDEDDTTGRDTDFSGAGGLHTFVINNTDFATINNKLWSTDWSTVFKTSTIDPIKCIMACKLIPFSADNVSSASVIIANMDTGLVKNYVKNVKSFTYDMGSITAVNRNFTDITLTRIHCYLPYVGWVELPASECMSRVAYKGVEANTKRLKVKYLIDFVDGTCRAIVSVNGTERWFFDGHCDIDIPITSDNHTNAVHNAIVSGVNTGLSIATGIAGAYTGNAGAIAGGVMGAVTNAPNMYPTYTYTATSNGSGYINHSMNTHIMIVVESPTISEPKNYAHKVGKPCNQVLSLGSLNGFTKCNNVCVDGINATPDELVMIKSLLESGVYL